VGGEHISEGEIVNGHTEGQWQVDGEDQFAKVLSADGYIIAETQHIHVGDLDDACDMHLANMRLIAAAPDLLAACEAADVVMDTAAMHGIGDLLPPAYRDSWAAAHTAIRAAIAKAKGHTP
jgi:hypothetical protein